MAQAFTLVELLVVLAIISALAAMLFPIISGAKASALNVTCVSQMRQVTAATNLYTSDYDDTFMPISYQPRTEATSRSDRTWVQLVLPYIRNFSVFKCPADTSSREKIEATFDEDLVPGDTSSQYYRASLHTNFGFNYQYLSPIQMMQGVWTARPRVLGMVSNPADTIMYLDSVWSRSSTGAPVGGGSWLVTPPCRYYGTTSGVKFDSFNAGSLSEIPVYSVSEGWSVQEAAPHVYGNAWPWHSGRLNMAKIDGSVRSIDPKRLSDGCELLEDWQGQIRDSGSYLWDLR
jgi:prepilin-type N-terminal cleavage/methylation domain-containing protein/prepilin-type processing-associated H-X9-DG protein